MFAEVSVTMFAEVSVTMIEFVRAYVANCAPVERIGWMICLTSVASAYTSGIICVTIASFRGMYAGSAPMRTCRLLLAASALGTTLTACSVATAA